MRERLARLFSVGVALLLVAYSALFAERRSATPSPGAGEARDERVVVPGDPSPPADAVVPGGPPPPADAVVPGDSPPPADPVVLARGRELFVSEGCGRCHSLEGVGSPRSPLDGVGLRLGPEALRDFIIGDGAARSSLSASILRAKARYQDLPEDDLRALVALMEAAR